MADTTIPGDHGDLPVYLATPATPWAVAGGRRHP